MNNADTRARWFESNKFDRIFETHTFISSSACFLTQVHLVLQPGIFNDIFDCPGASSLSRIVLRCNLTSCLIVYSINFHFPSSIDFNNSTDSSILFDTLTLVLSSVQLNNFQHSPPTPRFEVFKISFSCPVYHPRL